jgi:hypothetical protein
MDILRSLVGCQGRKRCSSSRQNRKTISATTIVRSRRQRHLSGLEADQKAHPTVELCFPQNSFARILKSHIAIRA